MKHSDSIVGLAAALAKAQAKVEGATKDATNPHFKSKYADLASVKEACLKALNENGLSVCQFPSADGNKVSLETVLIHSSGEWLAGEPLTVEARDAGAQSVGSAITYLRRYALASLAGVAPEDDDAEVATGRVAYRPAQVEIQPSNNLATEINAGLAAGMKKAAVAPARNFAQPVARKTNGADTPPPLTDSDIPF